MSLSPYTILFARNDKYYAFSTLTKTFIELDKEIYAALFSCTDSVIMNDTLDESSIRFLYDSHILCDNPKDEYLLCKSIILDRRNDETNMHLTIAPTMDCCFSCYYCFERNKQPVYMSLKTIDSILRFIGQIKNLEHLHVTWFGGEPLMAPDNIRYFSEKILSSFTGKYSSDIITTAYHINMDTIALLKEAHITEMQVSIDGKEETHNSVKFTQTGENSYQRILDNISMLTENYSSLQIGVRVNLTKQNYSEYIELYREFSKRFAQKNVSLLPGYVMSRNNGIDNTCLFTPNEIALFSLELWKLHKIPTPWIIYTNEQGECAIRKKNSLVIDASGYVYKCWEKIGDRKYSIGQLTIDGEIVGVDYISLRRYLYGADTLNNEKCWNCNMLPICFGGCPLLRIENEFEGKKNVLCTSYKGKVVEWLYAYIELKELLKKSKYD